MLSRGAGRVRLASLAGELAYGAKRLAYGGLPCLVNLPAVTRLLRREASDDAIGFRAPKSQRLGPSYGLVRRAVYADFPGSLCGCPLARRLVTLGMPSPVARNSELAAAQSPAAGLVLAPVRVWGLVYANPTEGDQ